MSEPGAGSRLLTRLLALYPPDYRREFGEEMQEAMMDAMMESLPLGFFAGAARLAQELWGLVVGAVREWFRKRDPLPALPSRLPLRGALGCGLGFLPLELWETGILLGPRALIPPPAAAVEICILLLIAGLIMGTALRLAGPRRTAASTAWQAVAVALGWGLATVVGSLFLRLIAYPMMGPRLDFHEPLAAFVLTTPLYVLANGFQGFGLGVGLAAARGDRPSILTLGAWGAAAFAVSRLMSAPADLVMILMSVSGHSAMLISTALLVARSLMIGGILGWALARITRRQCWTAEAS